jgi:hypothetical protein
MSLMYLENTTPAMNIQKCQNDNTSRHREENPFTNVVKNTVH